MQSIAKECVASFWGILHMIVCPIEMQVKAGGVVTKRRVEGEHLKPVQGLA